MNLDRFPRIDLCHAPTPLEFMPRLTQHLGGPQIWIKRDDCTGMALGGNKARKLEFLMGDALQQGADHVVTLGALQSNHVRQTAAAAARLGLACTVLLEHRHPNPDSDYLNNGNVLLDGLLGAEIVYRPGGTDMAAALRQMGDQLRAKGHRPYLIPSGGSNPVGTLGYVKVAQELLQQAQEKSLRLDHIVVASGSAGTQAGLVVGVAAQASKVAVQGFAVSQAAHLQHARVAALALATAQWIGDFPEIPPEAIRVNADYLGQGYSIPTPAMVQAVHQVARLEGILLDPVYTGKAMAGLMDWVRHGRYRSDENIVFIHTGGQAGLFGFCNTLSHSSRKAVNANPLD
jgi:L-cysteate sulfo-lyase